MACREVDLGPFKHKIDDGLELRKAAFECMDVLLERCKDCINMGHFITHLEQGLQVHLPFPVHLLVACHIRTSAMSQVCALQGLRHACLRISCQYACIPCWVVSSLTWSWQSLFKQAEGQLDKLCTAVLCCAKLSMTDSSPCFVVCSLCEDVGLFIPEISESPLLSNVCESSVGMKSSCTALHHSLFTSCN